MPRIPHLNDNYFEVNSALSAIICIHNVINERKEIIVKDLLKGEIYDEDPELNASIESQFLYYTDESVTRANTYSYILLVCSNIEKTIRLLISDGLEERKKSEGYGDYFQRQSMLPKISEVLVNMINDIFILRHWITHRHGRLLLQKISKDEEGFLHRAGDKIKNEGKYLVISHEYVDEIAKSVDIFMKSVAKKMYT